MRRDISKQVVEAFKAFDYPKFDFKFSTVKLKFEEGKIIKKAKKILGIISKAKWETKDLKYANNDDFKKYKKVAAKSDINYANQPIPVGEHFNTVNPPSIRRK